VGDEPNQLPICIPFIMLNKPLLRVMKHIFKPFLLAFCLFSCASIWAYPFQKFPKKDTISIFDAKLNGKLAISIRGAYDPNKLQPDLTSAHFGECIDIKLRNMSDSVISVVLRCGTMLLSRDSSFQNMVVTKTLFYTLKPGQKLYDRVYAMCGQLHKNSPDISIRYDVGEQAEEPLLRLAKLIEKTDNQNKAGQYAVWAVTDGATKDDLGEDFDALQQSQALLNKANIKANILGRHYQAAIPIIENFTETKRENTASAKNENTRTKNIANVPLTPKHQSKTEEQSSFAMIEEISENNAISIAENIKEPYLEKDDEFTNDLPIVENSTTESKNENYWLLFASFSVILFGLYYFWNKKPKRNSGKKENDVLT
jgi:hypothetical protein